MGLNLNIYSSALKLNTQYMHTIHFNLRLRRGITKEELMRRLQSNRRVAMTHKKSSAAVFSFGRDHGIFGRILNQTVIVTQSMTMRGDREIVVACGTVAAQPGRRANNSGRAVHNRNSGTSGARSMSRSWNSSKTSSAP